MEDGIHPILMGLGLHTHTRVLARNARKIGCFSAIFHRSIHSTSRTLFSLQSNWFLFLLRFFFCRFDKLQCTHEHRSCSWCRCTVFTGKSSLSEFVFCFFILWCAFAKNTRSLLHSESQRNETNVHSIAFISNSKHIELIRSNTLTPSKHYFGCFCCGENR